MDIKMRMKKRILFHGEAKKEEKRILCKSTLKAVNHPANSGGLQ